MKLNSEQTKAIMALAQTLQKQYDILGAPSTQNVRNPYPLHKLVVGVLPTRKSEALNAFEIQEKLQSWGYRVPIQSLKQTLSNMYRNNIIHGEKMIGFKNAEAKKTDKWSTSLYYSFSSK